MSDNLITMDAGIAGCPTKCDFSLTCNCCNVLYSCLCSLHIHMLSNSCVKQYLVDMVTSKVNIILHSESDAEPVAVDQKVSCIELEVHTSTSVESDPDDDQQHNDIDKQDTDIADGDDDDDIADESDSHDAEDDNEEVDDEDSEEEDVAEEVDDDNNDGTENQDSQLIKRKSQRKKSIKSTITDDDADIKFVWAPSDKGNKVKRRRVSYDRENLVKAYQATQQGMSVYRAAREYSVPESTLRDRTLGLYDVDVKPGPERLFSVDEEERMVNHINYMAGIGYMYSVTNMRYIAKDYGDSLYKNMKAKEALSNQWYYGFSKRWPNLMIGNPRNQPASKAQLKNYCKEFASVLTSNNLRDKPQNIYTIDETSIPSEHSPPKDTRITNKVPLKESTVTIIAAGNALGNSIPPYYVFPGQRWSPELLKEALPGADGEVTEAGWSDYNVFHNYLTQHFTKHVKLREHRSGTPTLVLYDGHKSHISLTLLEWARKHNVILFVLPPNSIHATQPLEFSVFGTLQSMFYGECQAFKRRHPKKNISKFQIAGFTAKPYLKAMSANTLTSAFRCTGVYPFDDKVIISPKVSPSKMYLHEDSDHESSEEN